MQTIEQTLYRKAATTRTGYNKETVAFNVPIPLFFDDDLFAIERGPRLTPDEPHDSAAPSASEKACGRLTGRAFAIHELPSLIDAMLSSKDMDGTIRRLSWDGTQAFVDVIDEALDRLDLPLSTKSKCLKLLHRTCGNYAILPGALKIPVLYDRTSNPLYSGGNSDVWKGEYCGRDVAVKVIRMYSNSDLRKVVGRFCKEVVLWRFLRHPNILPLLGVLMSDTRFAMVSHWMPNGNINEHVKAHPGLDRLELLTGVAGGLNYLHSIGMVHGDLKGSNVLIDEAGGARLADFGLLTIISDAANHLSSSTYTQGGTVRWMSPELIYPEEFGFKNSRPTKSSDCYALGMVIYETISGNPPFYECTDSHVALKVVAGEHPPRGVMFTQTLWKILESCWASRPNDRPNIEDILRRLENHCEVPESLHNPPGIGTWAGDTTAIGSTSVAPPLTHGIKPLFDLVSSVSRPPNPRSDCISGGTYLSILPGFPGDRFSPKFGLILILTILSVGLHLRTGSPDPAPQRFCKEVVMWKFLRHPNIVPIIGVLMLEFKFAMVSEWMANGIINEYIKAHPEVNRLGLLEGVARGLIYLHDIGLIHGDLKGSNILIDEAGQARLVDFGLMKIISDPVNNLPTSSNSQEGTLRWMSPELAYPDQYGLKKSSPTKSSDCYAFGMVIYEVIGGNPPFHEHRKPAVYLKLSRREHPSRGTSFTDSQWEVLGLCWASDPTHRPSIEVVLHRLQSAQTLPQLPSGQGGEVEKDGDESDSDRSAICDRLVEDYVKQSVQS
ncbi:kinase-like domain-containing protein [Thelephora terrestris]|uniref:Kinase-like domain-containing protein n=1 Tax=Thelephora terrestris TaxID=56493 RepID=A0A9P6HMQ8_9AGAM|nr:kinase-like domain-containing protein [Thelephora terrestris]